jgi:formylmethanofuran dehydrogenase subunit E
MPVMDALAQPPGIAFVGRSGSGKTTLLERVLPRLAAAGLRVGVVKHTHHQVEWDQPGKDSWRFAQAGAAAVVLATPDALLGRALRAGQAATLLPEVDLVLHEGDRGSPVDKVLVGESVEEARAKGTLGRVIAVVGGPAAPGLPRFDRDDVEGVAALLRGVANGGRSSFEALLERSVAAHGHLCPGQVLGVRMTMRGLAELGLPAPPPPKSVIAIIETDRCAADAVASVSGCSLGRRSLKHYDLGKMAASFLDLSTGRAVRVVARDDSRERVARYAPGIEDPHDAQTVAYRLMPDEELLRVQAIELRLDESDLPGRPRQRIPCSLCGEHVSDERHVIVAGRPLCRSCAGEPYYRVL